MHPDNRLLGHGLCVVCAFFLLIQLIINCANLNARSLRKVFGWYFETVNDSGEVYS